MMKERLTYATIVILLGVLPAFGAADRYDFKRTVLDNGLTVISLEDHTCPIVAVQVWYHVGSKNEDPHRQGFAHMFEHMMFRGTDRLGSEDHFNYVRATGGNCNAYTSFDNTTYINELPSNQLELALWLEAERMAFLRIDEEGFFTERAVVEEERRLRSLNTPYGTVPEKLLASLFTEHPYRWTPIGLIPHLRAATIDELQAFWDQYYVPNNATLVVVGDTTHAEVQALARQYFGWIPKCPAPKGVTIKEPPQTERRKITIPEKRGPAPIVGLVYRGVPVGHDDAVALQLLMNILGGGESSRIYKDIVKEQRLAEMAMAGFVPLEDDGICGAGAVLMPWGNKQKALDAISKHIRNLRENPVTQRELEKVKNQALRDAVTESLTVASKATLLGQFQCIEGDAGKANRKLDRIRAVTIDDVQRVAQTYLIPQRETVVVVQPKFGSVLGSLFGGGGSDVDEGAAAVVKPQGNRVASRGGPRANLGRPDGFPVKPPVGKLLTTIPETPHTTTTLANGLKVVVVENHEVPFVTTRLGLLHGAWTEELPGTAAMACALVTQGSAGHTAAEMAEELEFNAIRMGGSASMDVASVTASCLTEKFGLAMSLLAEVVLTPTFPSDEFNIARQQTLMGLMVQARTPEYLADRELRRRLFGGHPYARTPTGESADVQTLRDEDLETWWRANVRPDTTVLYIAGDIDPKSAFRIADEHFGQWKAEGDRTTPQVASIPKRSPTHIFLVDRPGSVQSQIRVGHTSITRKNRDYFTSRVLSQVFGGAFGSRLNKAIRIERGLTYGARGGIAARRFAGTMTISTFTKTPSTAEVLRVILDEIDSIRSSPIEEKELDSARSYIVGSFAGQRETSQAVVGDLWLIEYSDLPSNYLLKYLEGVKQTTAQRVLAAAQTLIDRDHLVIVVVGEAAAIKEDLERIAPVTVLNEQGEVPKKFDQDKKKSKPAA